MVEFLNYELTKNITTAIDLCIYLSYPLNFAIYCGMSRCTMGSLLTTAATQLYFRQFRDTFRLIIVAPLRRIFSLHIKTDKQTNQTEEPTATTKLKSRR